MTEPPEPECGGGSRGKPLPAPAHLVLSEDLQKVVGREAALLEDKVSAVLHKPSSQDQQLVCGRAGEQQLHLEQEAALGSSRSISRDSP